LPVACGPANVAGVTVTPRIRAEDRGLARVLVIDNPAKRNALDFQALEELEQAFARATRDGVRCLVLRGAGDEAFSSGFDIAEMARTSSRGDRPDEAVERTADALSDVPFPTIAFLNGFAFGGAFELAVTCDLRVARAGVKLAMTPAKLGVVYPEGGLRRFVDLVGAARARELFFTGRPIDAETAFAWGLVNRVGAGATVEDEALALANEIAENAPLAVRGMKRIMRLLEGTHERGLAAAERDEIAALRRAAFESADLVEGRSAWEERRRPRFKGE
jgi:enoyl-CoA hydratase